jgi:hypothetical protein
MASVNPEIYYNDPVSNSYVYESLEQMVNNFLTNYCGDGTKLGDVPRHKVIFWFKKGFQHFNIDALQEVKAVELELGDTLDIILPPDYLNFVRISWIHPTTGELMPMSINDSLPLATSYLQDHNAEILFDHNGEILEGSSYLELINDALPEKINQASVLGCGVSCAECQYYANGCNNTTMRRLPSSTPSKNINGSFNIDTRQGRIHFTSDNATRAIMLEYISDGLEYSNESDIKLNKIAEMAMYDWVNWNLLSNTQNMQMYEVQNAKKQFDTKFRNTKIKLMNIRIRDVFRRIKNNG